MEPAQAKPLRRRRRWLIVALLLVLVSGVAWWEWPRGDARFVGKWKYTEGSVNGIMTLQSNGNGRIELTGYRGSFTWRVMGDRFVKSRDFQLVEAVAIWIRQRFSTSPETTVVAATEEKRIIAVANKRILLKSGPETITLDRLAE